MEGLDSTPAMYNFHLPHAIATSSTVYLDCSSNLSQHPLVEAERLTDGSVRYEFILYPPGLSAA